MCLTPAAELAMGGDGEDEAARAAGEGDTAPAAPAAADGSVLVTVASDPDPRVMLTDAVGTTNTFGACGFDLEGFEQDPATLLVAPIKDVV